MCNERFPTAPSGRLVVGAQSAGAPVRLSLVVPTFNESANIQPFLEALRDNLDPVLGGAYEVIVVDDDSPDRSWEVASNVARTYPQLRVMRRIGEKGLSTAVIRGWQVSKGEVLGTINADFQHPPSAFAEMLQKMESADLVVATRLRQRRIGRRISAASKSPFGRCQKAGRVPYPRSLWPRDRPTQRLSTLSAADPSRASNSGLPDSKPSSKSWAADR